MSLKVKKMIVALVFVLSIPFVCGSTCDESGSNGGGRGTDWLRCESVTCTYQTKLNGAKKTAISGVRINRANAVALKGRWVSVK